MFLWIKNEKAVGHHITNINSINDLNEQAV